MEGAGWRSGAMAIIATVSAVLTDGYGLVQTKNRSLYRGRLARWGVGILPARSRRERDAPAWSFYIF